MNVPQHLARLGGVGARRDLLRVATRAEVDRSLRSGDIVRDGRGRYALPVVDEALRVANRLDGVVSHRSAALWWGWAQKVPDHDVEITVPRKRKVDPRRREGVSMHWADLDDRHVDGGHTARERTIIDCMRSLPFDEALAIADSALRAGSFLPEELVGLAALVRGPGAAQCRRVARHADGRADNPFESVLRAIALDVPRLALVPQVVVAQALRPDLVDVDRWLVVEADSFAWHGSRSALRRDCRRYNRLVLLGYVVLRFAWEDVMHDAPYVRAALTDAVRVVDRRAQRAVRREKAA